MARPGPKRDVKNARPEIPNTPKLARQLVRVGRSRGCDLAYLQTLLKEEWDREVRDLEKRAERAKCRLAPSAEAHGESRQ